MIYNTPPVSGMSDWILGTGFPQEGVGDLEDLKVDLGIGQGGKWIGFIRPGWFYSSNIEQYHYVLKGEIQATVPVGSGSITTSPSFHPAWGPVRILTGPPDDRLAYIEHFNCFWPALAMTWTQEASGVVSAVLPDDCTLVGVRDLSNLSLGAVAASGELITERMYYHDRSAGKIYTRPKDPNNVNVYADIIYHAPQLRVREIVVQRDDGTVQASYRSIADVKVEKGASYALFSGSQDGISILHGIDGVEPGDWLALEYYVQRSFVLTDHDAISIYSTPTAGEDVIVSFETSVPDVIPPIQLRVPGSAGSTVISSVWSSRIYGNYATSFTRSGATENWVNQSNGLLEDSVYTKSGPLAAGDKTYVWEASGFIPAASLPVGATLTGMRLRVGTALAVPPTGLPVDLYCDLLTLLKNGSSINDLLGGVQRQVGSGSVWTYNLNPTSLGITVSDVNSGTLGLEAGMVVVPSDPTAFADGNWQITYDYFGHVNSTTPPPSGPQGAIRLVKTPIILSGPASASMNIDVQIRINVLYIGGGTAPTFCPLQIFAKADYGGVGDLITGSCSDGLGDPQVGNISTGTHVIKVPLSAGAGSYTVSQSIHSTSQSFGDSECMAQAEYGVTASISTVVPVTGMIDFVSMEFQYTTSVDLPGTEGQELLNFNPLFQDAYRAGYLINADIQTPLNGMWEPSEIHLEVDREEVCAYWNETIKLTVTLLDKNGLPIPKYPVHLVADCPHKDLFVTPTPVASGSTYIDLTTDNRGEIHWLVTPITGGTVIYFAAYAGTVSASAHVAQKTVAAMLDTNKYLNGQTSIIVTENLTARRYKLGYVAKHYLDGIPREVRSGITVRTEQASTLEYRKKLDGLLTPLDSVSVHEAVLPTLQSLTQQNIAGVAAFGVLPQPNERIVALTSTAHSRITEIEQ